MSTVPKDVDPDKIEAVVETQGDEREDDRERKKETEANTKANAGKEDDKDGNRRKTRSMSRRRSGGNTPGSSRGSSVDSMTSRAAYDVEEPKTGMRRLFKPIVAAGRMGLGGKEYDPRAKEAVRQDLVNLMDPSVVDQAILETMRKLAEHKYEEVSPLPRSPLNAFIPGKAMDQIQFDKLKKGFSGQYPKKFTEATDHLSDALNNLVMTVNGVKDGEISETQVILLLMSLFAGNFLHTMQGLLSHHTVQETIDHLREFYCPPCNTD